MKVVYDDKVQLYGVYIEPSDTVTWLNTNDIVEAREMYIKRMTMLFNDAICEQLKD